MGISRRGIFGLATGAAIVGPSAVIDVIADQPKNIALSDLAQFLELCPSQVNFQTLLELAPISEGLRDRLIDCLVK